MIGRRVAAEILALEEDANPAVIELATLVSLSSRIEPELLRAVRLAAAPQLHVGAEGDLWFSPLVASRGPDGITFHPEVTEVLRRRLRDRVKRETVEQAWRVTQRLHRDLSPALALEEKVAWHAVVEASASTQAIENELSRALVTLIEGARPGVARWIAQAWPRLPAEARRTRTAWQLKEAAGPYLGAYRIRADETPERLGEVDLRATVERLPDVRMPVRRVGRLIQLGRVKPDRAVAIRVPDTDPRLIELRWIAADRGHTELVQVRPGGTAHHTVGFGPVELRTLRGALYQLSGMRPVAVFLASTASDGEALASQLANELLSHGFRLERLPDRPQPVAGLRAMAEASLDAADLLVLLLTPDALRSQGLQAAWRGALGRGKPILSAMMGIVADELPEQLRSLQPMDLRGLDLDEAVGRLLTAIDTITEAVPEERQEPTSGREAARPGMSTQGLIVQTAGRRDFAMTIVAQDPSVGNERGMLRAVVPVPDDRLEPGPRSQRFQVIDYDATSRVMLPPAVLGSGHGPGDWEWVEPDVFSSRSDAELLSDPAFHAQNVYAIAARTLAVFESAIGRRLNWGFPGHELYLVPHAMAEANAYAYYADDVRAVLFGYLPARVRRATRNGPGLRIARSGRLDPDAIYTCLSHDVIAHETTHAVLDGLRPRFLMPGLPDQPAFHEGLADIVALLSVFSLSEVVRSLLGQADLEGRIADRSVTDQELKKNALFTLAEQVGSALKDERGSALRDSIRLRPSTRWASDPQYGEPHSRGEILVWIILESLAGIWRLRLKDIAFGGSVSLARAAEEGATAAQHLLGMCVRAIDYLPPVEFEFPDFLAALLVSDAEIVPDDKHGYRIAVRDAFARWGIADADTHIADLSRSGLTAVYRNLSYTALRSDTDEVLRFIRQNLELLQIDPRFNIYVEHVRPSVRVGPNGMVVDATVAEYVQSLEGTPGELTRAIGLRVPRAVPRGTRVRVLGGGTIVFDGFGQAKYHHRKDIRDTGRQQRRLNYLINNGLFDGDSLGMSDGMPAGERFAILHQPDADRQETW